MAETNIKAETSAVSADPAKEKVLSLYRFLQELGSTKQKKVLDIAKYPWYRALKDVPEDPDYIAVSYRDRVEEDTADDVGDGDNTLLRVRKPEFQKCPEPDKSFRDWIEGDWTDFAEPVSHKETLEEETAAEQQTAETAASGAAQTADETLAAAEAAAPAPSSEHFGDSEERAAAYEAWLEKRRVWVDRQRLTARTRTLFYELYGLRMDLEKDEETLEIVAADGIFRDRDNDSLCHPVITRRVNLKFHPLKNEMTISDTDVETEFCSGIFQGTRGLNLDSIGEVQEELRREDYHPFDRNDEPEFLKTLVRQLSADGVYAEGEEPADWEKTGRCLILKNPMFIVRKRSDGTEKAIGGIIENIQATGWFPETVRDIVSGGTVELPDDKEETLTEQLAAVGGESVDVLLSKEANREQLEIAKRIERYNAVLVQGPPGTGKTHTIANLMGHFLAQGKSVLVTSHTKKALTVLKEKVVPELQDLCVSVLDDSNLDMERSIDGITGHMAKSTSHELKREMDRAAEERTEVMKKLADIRTKIFETVSREYTPISVNGETLSPIEAAEYVFRNQEKLSFIPGTVKKDAALPLTEEEFADLYRSNEGIGQAEETELGYELPAPEELIAPDEFYKIREELNAARESLGKLKNDTGWDAEYVRAENAVSVFTGSVGFRLAGESEEKLEKLLETVRSFGEPENWKIRAAVDGRRGGASAERWNQLVKLIDDTVRKSDAASMALIGKEVTFADSAGTEGITAKLQNLKAKISGKHSFGWGLKCTFDPTLTEALNAVRINGKEPDTAEDCDTAICAAEIAEARKQCASYWDALLAANGVPAFASLDSAEPERIAGKWTKNILKYLSWYEQDLSDLKAQMKDAGIPEELVFVTSELDSDETEIRKTLEMSRTVIPNAAGFFRAVMKLKTVGGETDRTMKALSAGKRSLSDVCRKAMEAVNQGDPDAYAESFAVLKALYGKYSLKKNREAYLERLSAAAPDWADAVRKREGLHGESHAPAELSAAWKWKQYSRILSEITAVPFAELQEESLSLSKRYRTVTAQYAEKSAWYHLLRRTEGDIDMKQALIGWKQTVKRIGKGTGKNAPMYRAKARQLMARCQTAVPGWIMPMGKALESLDPKTNRFDIMIVDEASQSDITALAVAYMGKKLIIVGDDKQVSPMAVGVENDKMNYLIQTYLKDRVPNYHLYNAKMSLYDVAATTFQPLMLREHFRCVPDIIGFSNMLSYDYKIRALRDAGSSELLPAVVNYRAENGKRNRAKINEEEAAVIVSLMRGCMEQKEYDGKTFGVISMVGDQQAELIQQLIGQQLDLQEIEKRRILCGNAANFQGDERDVVFLSLVDTADDAGGPLNRQENGADDSIRKRYNVAASRAKDQLWVVSSLDPAADLKSGDIRKTLMEYAEKPSAFRGPEEETGKTGASAFEKEIAGKLGEKGYRVELQWPVGAYRLDMVVMSGDKKAAVECDGERWNIGETRIREDMERQTILQRLGWRFIRLRGSAYYLDPEKALAFVTEELEKIGIRPAEESAAGGGNGPAEGTAAAAGSTPDTDLLTRVRNAAERIRKEDEEKKAEEKKKEEIKAEEKKTESAGEKKTATKTRAARKKTVVT